MRKSRANPSEERTKRSSIRLRNRSFGTKLLLYGGGASLFALVLAMTSILLYDTSEFRNAFVERISGRADILSRSCASALVFRDPTSAERTLADLNVKHDVIAACVYDETGELFAQFVQEGKSYVFPRPPSSPTHLFREGGLDIFRLIQFKNERVGMIHIRANPYELRVRFQRYLLISGAVLLVSFLASVGLALCFKKSMTRPIRDLVEVTETVSKTADYAVRAKKFANDEVGLLADAFNQMIHQIQRRKDASQVLTQKLQTSEQQLQASNQKLETRVLERTAELQITNQELESFSYSVSHDLRAPLRAIDGFSLVLLEDHAQKLDPEAQEHLDRIRAATQRMGRLIDDLLDLSRMNRQPLHKAPVALGPLVQKTLEHLRAEQADRRIELNLGDLPLLLRSPYAQCRPWLEVDFAARLS